MKQQGHESSAPGRASAEFVRSFVVDGRAERYRVIPTSLAEDLPHRLELHLKPGRSRLIDETLAMSVAASARETVTLITSEGEVLAADGSAGFALLVHRFECGVLCLGSGVALYRTEPGPSGRWIELRVEPTWV